MTMAIRTRFPWLPTSIRDEPPSLRLIGWGFRAIITDHVAGGSATVSIRRAGIDLVRRRDFDGVGEARAFAEAFISARVPGLRARLARPAEGLTS
jgi:hypothetical protein